MKEKKKKRLLKKEENLSDCSVTVTKSWTGSCLRVELIFLFSFTKAVIQKGTSKPWSDFRLWKVFLFGLSWSVSHRIPVYFSQHFGFNHSVRHEPQCVPTTLISAKRKIKHLLDVLGESETYFLPSGWKLENHQLKFSSRLPLRNIHHLPVRGLRAGQFQFFDHRFTSLQGAPDRALRGSVGLWAPPRPLEECPNARDQNVHQRSQSLKTGASAWRIFLPRSTWQWLWSPRQQDSHTVVSFSFFAALQVPGWG